MKENLPRTRIKMSDNEIILRFERLGYTLAIEQIAFTTESVEDFFVSRETLWSVAGHLVTYEPLGILVVEKAQPRPNQRTRDIVVVSLGHARAVMGVLKPANQSELPRYAPTME